MRLYHTCGNSDAATLVVFGDDTTGPRGNPATDLGIDALVGRDLYEIVPTAANWYPAVETVRMCEAIAARKGSRPGVALGASMGGYGALRYGKLAGCGTALAFSPQARIGPRMVGIGARHASRYDAVLHGRMDIDAGNVPGQAFAVVDPAEPHDVFHAELLRHEAGVDVIALPHMGHRTERAFTSAEVVDAALLCGQLGERAALASVLRLGRHQAPQYLARLSIACSQKGHYRWASDLASTPERDGSPGSPDLRMALAVARAGLGQPIEALIELEALIVSAPRNVRYWRALADQYDALGQMGAAAEVLELALAETGSFHFCWSLIRNRIAVGEHEQAHLLTDLALEYWPERSAQIERMRARIGPTD